MIVVCPECHYSPVFEAYGNPRTDKPVTREESLDFYDTIGADEGCVFCNSCGCEFDSKTLEIREYDDPDAQ